jgi:hypothetical protein
LSLIICYYEFGILKGGTKFQEEEEEPTPSMYMELVYHPFVRMYRGYEDSSPGKRIRGIKKTI